jgi:hypothetical protein
MNCFLIPACCLNRPWQLGIGHVLHCPLGMLMRYGYGEVAVEIEWGVLMLISCSLGSIP